MEDDTKKLNQSLSDLNLDELLTLWNAQKKKTQTSPDQP